MEGRDYDVIVVGAGFGGIYGAHRFLKQGLKVLGLEGAPGVGGVWYHNRYPGARVDIESIDYCYYFSPEVYREWKWSERYATQPELLRYLNHVADRFDVKRHFRFNTWMTGAQWKPEDARYEVKTSAGDTFTARFLVMATGNLSQVRQPDFRGLDRYKGEWVQTSQWPEREVKIAGRRIAVIGTGSSGVQTIPVVAETAAHVTVFQRSPNFSVPAWNGPLNRKWEEIREKVPEEREGLFNIASGQHRQKPPHPAASFTPEQQRERLEAAWAHGGHGMSWVFSDQSTNKEANDLVANFVRDKIRSIVKDPKVAEKLCPFDHPIGTRRLCVDTNYYATYNRPNVTLVDINEDPIEEFTETGIRTKNNRFEFDLVIFALGFHAFTGAIDNANIRNERGASPTDHWKRGPKTLLGLMTTGFPNLFTVTGPGSPSVLANMSIENEFHMDWIGDCIAYLDAHGKRSIEPTEEGQEKWTAHVAEVSSKLLRRGVRNYMVHVNDDDGSRVFMPYVGGMDRYVQQARAMAANGYEGFRVR